jgi:ribosomal protein L11 methylase PrmA
VIRPSWEEYTAQKDELVVTLDPGMAFGTGQHDTTRFCAELIGVASHELGLTREEAPKLRHETPKTASFLDIGCGSGILSIIAAKLGFSPVLGIDNDAIAIETSLENRERNAGACRRSPAAENSTGICLTSSDFSKGPQRSDGYVSGRFVHLPCQTAPLKFSLSQGSSDRLLARHKTTETASFNPEFLTTLGGLDNLPHAPFDVIVANIFAETVCELKSAMLKLLKPEGRLILSGVIRDADPLIRSAFADMKLQHYRTSQEWHAYIYRR